MCVQDSEQVRDGMENCSENQENSKAWPLHSPLVFSPSEDDTSPQIDNWEKGTILDHVPLRNSFPVRIKKWDLFSNRRLIFRILLFHFLLVLFVCVLNFIFKSISGLYDFFN